MLASLTDVMHCGKTGGQRAGQLGRGAAWGGRWRGLRQLRGRGMVDGSPVLQQAVLPQFSVNQRCRAAMCNR